MRLIGGDKVSGDDAKEERGILRGAAAHLGNNRVARKDVGIRRRVILEKEEEEEENKKTNSISQFLSGQKYRKDLPNTWENWLWEYADAWGKRKVRS